MAASPATTLDLIRRWRPLSDQEDINGAVFISDAWRMLRRKMTRLGVDIEALIATDDDLKGDVVRVICAAVLRVMKNPEGKRSESIDDYTWVRDQAVSAGLLYFSDDELDDLVPGTTQNRAYTIDPLAGRDWSDWS